ncbi:alpha/beta hydrolase family protein [Oceaniserpentilla sp. 4NH20-0058]
MGLTHAILLFAADEAETPSPDSQDAVVNTPEPAKEISPPKEYVTPDKAKERNQDVIRYLKSFQRENELIEIVGKNGNMSGLYLPENTGMPQGGVLILHDIEQHAHWPNTVTPIREYLPDYGWNTLSIFYNSYIKKPLPKIEPLQLAESQADQVTTDANTLDPNAENQQAENQQSENTAEPNPTDSNELTDNLNNNEVSNTSENPNTPNELADPLDAVAENINDVPDFVPPIPQSVLKQPVIPTEDIFIENMIQRTEDGLNSLNTMGQFNTAIIANGLSANWAAKMLQARLNGNKIGYALILIDAKESQYPEIDLNETLAELDIPMLDIITQDSPEQLRLSKARKGSIKRKQNKKYQQIYLPAVKYNLNNTDNMISRRIRGWLLTNAAGEEVPVKVRNY